LCWTERSIVTPATVVHHIKDHGSDRAEFFYGALMSLCRDCHETRHNRAPRPWIGEDGLPLSPFEQAERKAEHDIKRETNQ